jgi:hypothetical protein
VHRAVVRATVPEKIRRPGSQEGHRFTALLFFLCHERVTLFMTPNISSEFMRKNL